MNVSERDLTTLRAILRRSFPRAGVQFYLFGSRVNGGARPDSDLDVLIVSDVPVPPRVLGDVREAFEESRLPFRVDVVDAGSLSDDFHRRIAPNAAKLEV
jgi:hypothetical protein